jgi:hypothetical protein
LKIGKRKRRSFNSGVFEATDPSDDTVVAIALVDGEIDGKAVFEPVPLQKVNVNGVSALSWKEQDIGGVRYAIGKEKS